MFINKNKFTIENSVINEVCSKLDLKNKFDSKIFLVDTPNESIFFSLSYFFYKIYEPLIQLCHTNQCILKLIL